MIKISKELCHDIQRLAQDKRRIEAELAKWSGDMDKLFQDLTREMKNGHINNTCEDNGIPSAD